MIFSHFEKWHVKLLPPSQTISAVTFEQRQKVFVLELLNLSFANDEKKKKEGRSTRHGNLRVTQQTAASNAECRVTVLMLVARRVASKSLFLDRSMAQRLVISSMRNDFHVGPIPSSQSQKKSCDSRHFICVISKNSDPRRPPSPLTHGATKQKNEHQPVPVPNLLRELHVLYIICVFLIILLLLLYSYILIMHVNR